MAESGSVSLLVKGGRVVLPSGLAEVDLLCADGKVAATGRELPAEGARVLDARGLLVGPGFIDVHVHGGGGHSFFTSDPANVRAYARWAPRNGVTAFLVSTLGRTALETTAAFAALRPAIGSPAGAEALGFHMEGPFINPERKGAFPPGMLRAPDAAEFERHQAAAGGLIRQVTLAPELPGALDLIAAITGSGAMAAMGHTDATAEEARHGFEAGIRHVTHLYNAMRPLHQREGGPSVAALLDGRVSCELICDGAHVAPEVLRMAYAILGPERAVVVTDNLYIAGTSSEGGTFAGEAISVEGARAVRGDGTIVGSVATMDQHFRNAVDFLGIDVATAFRLCSTNPARVAGATGRKGVIAEGADADLVLLDDHLRVVATVCRGEVSWEGTRGLQRE